MKKYLDVSLYVVVSSISFVFIDKVGSKIDPLLLLFMMTCISMLWFHAINIAKLSQIYVACLNNFSIFLAMTVFIGINWLCSIYAPSSSDPFIYLSANFVAQVMIGYTDNFIKTKSKLALISFILLAVALIILYYNYHISAGRNLALGMELGIIAGMMGYFYSVCSAKLQHLANLSSTQILAVRFWLLLIGLGFFLEHQQHGIHLSITDFFIIITMAFLCLIIPIYFLQQTVKKYGSQFAAIGSARVPLIVFILYSLSQKEFNLGNFMVCLAITISLRAPDIIVILRRLINLAKRSG
jgi:drug/metabolite transporter (DMT)-like permease